MEIASQSPPFGVGLQELHRDDLCGRRDMFASRATKAGKRRAASIAQANFLELRYGTMCGRSGDGESFLFGEEAQRNLDSVGLRVNAVGFAVESIDE